LKITLPENFARPSLPNYFGWFLLFLTSVAVAAVTRSISYSHSTTITKTKGEYQKKVIHGAGQALFYFVNCATSNQKQTLFGTKVMISF
jgi:hypothetical protein